MKGNTILVLTLMVAMIMVCGTAMATEPPALTVVFMAGLEPLCWEENGKPMGEQPEIAQYVISKLGIKAKYLFLPWARAQIMVELGEADLMMTTPSMKRFGYAVFGKEMTTPNYWNIFIKKEKVELIGKARNFKLDVQVF